MIVDTGFALEASEYFPGNVRVIGNWFPHHELQATFRAIRVPIGTPDA